MKTDADLERFGEALDAAVMAYAKRASLPEALGGLLGYYISRSRLVLGRTQTAELLYRQADRVAVPESTEDSDARRS